ncbi:MAG: TPM domain-containing protein, partial [Verrucomicrobiota bacterium]|nr:TPM domain-containing protein [Verrucomicrobiota bacterium]
DAEIVEAIRAAERMTSGEIRVYISRKKIKDALAAAQRRFAKLEMHKTRDRNAVLIYFAPRSRVFAIAGDAGVHEKCGDAFWQEVTAELSSDLRAKKPTEALVNAIGKIGALLAAHFPRRPDDRDELPNVVERD